MDVAQSQDTEVGDGTTTVVLLTGEILKLVKPYVEEGMHTHFISNGIRLSADKAVEAIKELQVCCCCCCCCSCCCLLCLFTCLFVYLSELICLFVCLPDVAFLLLIIYKVCPEIILLVSSTDTSQGKSSSNIILR